MGRLAKFKDLLPRTLSSIALLGMGYLLFFGTPFIAFSILSVLSILCLYEFVLLVRKIKNNYFFKFFFFCYVLLGTVSLFMLFSNQNHSLFWVGGALIITIASDITAYFTGRIIGGVKPFPSISPGKTLSGYIGGLCFGTAAGLYWFFCHYDLISSPIILCLSVFSASLLGQGGDLAESYLKRLANEKDSGFFLPGHGGFLDRFDAFFAAIIVMALCYFIVGNH